MKQESKQLTVDEQIELLWQSNSKIPFMQSKDILAFGYKQGIESVQSVNDKKSPINTVSNSSQSKNDGFTGNSKELIEYANKRQAKNVSENKNHELMNDILVHETKLKLLKDLLKYISEKQDLVDVYRKVKNMIANVELDLSTLHSAKNK